MLGHIGSLDWCTVKGPRPTSIPVSTSCWSWWSSRQDVLVRVVLSPTRPPSNAWMSGLTRGVSGAFSAPNLRQGKQSRVASSWVTLWRERRGSAAWPRGRERIGSSLLQSQHRAASLDTHMPHHHLPTVAGWMDGRCSGLLLPLIPPHPSPCYFWEWQTSEARGVVRGESVAAELCQNHRRHGLTCVSMELY